VTEPSAACPSIRPTPAIQAYTPAPFQII